MAMGYLLQYIVHNSQPGIIALEPISSLYGYLAGVVTFLYPLATKLFTAMPLVPKPFWMVSL